MNNVGTDIDIEQPRYLTRYRKGQQLLDKLNQERKSNTVNFFKQELNIHINNDEELINLQEEIQSQTIDQLIEIKNNQNEFSKTFERCLDLKNDKWDKDFRKLNENLEGFANSVINRIKTLEDKVNNTNYDNIMTKLDELGNKMADFSSRIRKLEDNQVTLLNQKSEIKEIKQIIRKELQEDVNKIKNSNNKFITEKELLIEKIECNENKLQTNLEDFQEFKNNSRIALKDIELTGKRLIGKQNNIENKVRDLENSIPEQNKIIAELREEINTLKEQQSINSNIGKLKEEITKEVLGKLSQENSESLQNNKLWKNIQEDYKSLEEREESIRSDLKRELSSLLKSKEENFREIVTDILKEYKEENHWEKTNEEFILKQVREVRNELETFRKENKTTVNQKDNDKKERRERIEKLKKEILEIGKQGNEQEQIKDKRYEEVSKHNNPIPKNKQLRNNKHHYKPNYYNRKRPFYKQNFYNPKPYTNRKTNNYNNKNFNYQNPRYFRNYNFWDYNNNQDFQEPIIYRGKDPRNLLY